MKAPSTALASVFLLGACAPSPPSFHEPMALGGQTVSAATLNAGREAYSFYCQACHGGDGDGRGPAAVELETPPRDFRTATYKFAAVKPGFLPPDSELERIVKTGLNGTAMLHWDVPDAVLSDIIQYIKTFSPPGDGWRDPDAEIGEPIVGADDPWGDGRRDAAVARGREVYHGTATCYTCHPAYATVAEINRYREAIQQPPLTSLRPKAWIPEPKETTAFTAPLAGDPACERTRDCGSGQVCRLGRCERTLWLLPPDFTLNLSRTGTAPADLYRVIAAGIPGTAMPTWEGAIPGEDIWAMAYFVDHLAQMRGTAEATRLKEAIKADAAGGTGSGPDR